MVAMKEHNFSADWKKFERMEWGERFAYFFSRDPFRWVKFDPYIFYSPADGFINYYDFVGLDDTIVYEGRRQIKLRDIIQVPVRFKRAHVVSIFMTSASVHVNRIPTSGIVVFMKELEPLVEEQISMRPSEEHYYQYDAPRTWVYQIKNERVVSRIYCPRLCYSYWIVQIADKDVDAILNFVDVGDALLQGERFGIVRWGSDVILILPESPRFDFLFLSREREYVYAGITPLFRVIIKN